MASRPFAKVPFLLSHSHQKVGYWGSTRAYCTLKQQQQQQQQQRNSIWSTLGSTQTFSLTTVNITEKLFEAGESQFI